jgi:hypothetical protein
VENPVDDEPPEKRRREGKKTMTVYRTVKVALSRAMGLPRTEQEKLEKSKHMENFRAHAKTMHELALHTSRCVKRIFSDKDSWVFENPGLPVDFKLDHVLAIVNFLIKEAKWVPESPA